MKPRDRVAQGSRFGVIIELSRRHKVARVKWHDSSTLEYENTLDLELITKEDYDERARRYDNGE